VKPAKDAKKDKGKKPAAAAKADKKSQKKIKK